jgi:DNA-binding XRE family transcriptional regulator
MTYSMRISHISFIQNYVFKAGGDNLTRDIIKQYELFTYNKGWNQTEAAEAIGCSQEHLSRIFKGTKNPSVKLLDKMEEVMQNDR